MDEDTPISVVEVIRVEEKRAKTRRRIEIILPY